MSLSACGISYGLEARISLIPRGSLYTDQVECVCPFKIGPLEMFFLWVEKYKRILTNDKSLCTLFEKFTLGLILKWKYSTRPVCNLNLKLLGTLL